MRVQYHNHQDELDPMSGAVIFDGVRLVELLEGIRKKRPFVAALRGDNGFELMFGIGSGVGCVEHKRIDGNLPYLMAMPAQTRVKSGYVEFLMNNTPTPISSRYILNFDEVKQIALHFLETGERSDAFSWESI
jgi:Immunity protein Imm1